MSGGEAFVLDETEDFVTRCNGQGVSLERLSDPEEIAEIRAMIQRHLDYTRSQRAAWVLESWDKLAPKFVKVLPHDYTRRMDAIKKAPGRRLERRGSARRPPEDNAKDVACAPKAVQSSAAIRGNQE